MTKLKEDFEASGGVWKEWRIGDLFLLKSNPQLDKDNFVFSENAKYPYFTRTVFNNGIFGNVEFFDNEHLIKGNSIAVGMMGMQFFYMCYDFYAGQFTKTAYPRFSEFNENIALYFISLLNRFQKKYLGVLVRNFEDAFYNTYVTLPTLKNEPSYSYMEQYITLLEEEKMLQVEKFLKDSGLNDTTLTAEETAALEKFRNGEVKFEERKICELFEIKKGKRLTKANMKPGMTNFLGAISNNNGIREQIEAPFTWKPNCISVNYNGSVGYSFYQEYEFYASDDVNLCYAKEWALNKYIALYFCAIFFKYSNVFNFGFKWSKEKMEESLVKVPVTLSNIPDFAFMQHFISALEKLVMRGVVKYKDEVLNADDKALDFAVAAEQILNYGQKSEF